MLRSIVAIVMVVAFGLFAGGAYWQFVVVPGQQTGGPGGAPGGGKPGAGGPGGGMPPMGVEAVAVQAGPAQRNIEAIGTLVSNESVVVRPEVSGRVVSLGFDEGGEVTQGQVIVALDVAIQQAELDQARVALELSQTNLQRAQELKDRSAGTQRALDEALAAMRTNTAVVALNEARVAQYTLKAPFDAVAGLRKVSIGDFVDKGTEIVNLEQIDPLKVDLRVPEIFLSAVAVGQPVGVTLDAFPGQTFAGEVVAIDPLVEQGGRAVVIRAKIANPDGRLRPGPVRARRPDTRGARQRPVRAGAGAGAAGRQAVRLQGERQRCGQAENRGTGAGQAGPAQGGHGGDPGRARSDRHGRHRRRPEGPRRHAGAGRAAWRAATCTRGTRARSSAGPGCSARSTGETGARGRSRHQDHGMSQEPPR